MEGRHALARATRWYGTAPALTRAPAPALPEVIMPRLFIAIPMPEEVAAQLERLCVGLPATRLNCPT